MAYQLRINNLCNVIGLALDDVPCVHFDFAVFDGEGEEIERAWGGGIFHGALLIKLGVVTRADEFLRGRVPRDGAAQMGATMIDSEKSAITDADDVETSVRDVGDRVYGEVIHQASGDDRAEFAFG